MKTSDINAFTVPHIIEKCYILNELTFLLRLTALTFETSAHIAIYILPVMACLLPVSSRIKGYVGSMPSITFQ